MEDHICPECNGKGHTSPGFLCLIPTHICENCDGYGLISDSGEPVDPLRVEEELGEDD